MDLMHRLASEAMEIEAPSQLDEELRSFSKPNLTTAPDDPSTPNTKEVRLDDEDSHSECGGGTSAREMPPWHRRGSARKAPKKSPTEVPTGKARCRRGSAPKGVSLSWTASTPQSLSVSALFVSKKEERGIAQKRLAASTSIATCIPLWPTYALEIKGTVDRLELKAERWLHFEKREEWVQAILGIDGSRANKSIDEPKQLLTAAIRATRRKLSHYKPDSSSDESSNEDQAMQKEWNSSKKWRMLKITVLEHTLVVVNSLRPIALRCDDDTISFLKAVAVPLITKARSQSDTVPVTEPPAPFNFSDKAPFTFPGRVVWMPTTNSYELKLSGKGATQLDKRSTTTALEGKPLQVPPGLRGSEFQDARKRICHLACLAWNQRDRSTRPRFFPGEGRDREAEGTAE